MMLYAAIKKIYPSISDLDFSLQDDGNGPYIELWKSNQPLPTQEQLAVAGAAALAEFIVQAAHARINTAYSAAVNAITAGYPQNEIDSWPKQEAEARAHLADNAALTPWIDSAAASRSITKSDFVALVIANADALAPIHGALTGKRQKLRDQITALGDSPTQEQLDAVQW